MKFYDYKPILKIGAKYNLIFGERSSGKSHGAALIGLENFVKTGKQTAIIRRYREDFRGKRGQAYLQSLTCDGYGKNKVKELTKGKFDKIVYQSSQWFLAYWDKDTQRNVLDEKPCFYAFALSEMEHDKSTSYNDVTTIILDEYITRSAYLPEEFVLFMNCLSTIIRGRDDVTIFMLANTIAAGQYNPYHREMGLKNVDKMSKGTIDVYNYGASGLKVAVEYTDSPNKKGKPSDVYFAFDNPKLAMITGGDWEFDIYPHLTKPINKKDIVYSYFIEFDDKLMQADIIINDLDKFTFIHDKTTPIKRPEQDVLFTVTPTEQHNVYTNLLKPVNKLTKRIYEFYVANKVFYSSNDVGELVNQYILNCNKRMR